MNVHNLWTIINPKNGCIIFDINNKGYIYSEESSAVKIMAELIKEYPDRRFSLKEISVPLPWIK